MTIRQVDRCRVERLVEQALFGPLDLTIRVLQELPTAVDTARRRLLVARVVGKLAVDQGVLELRRRLDEPNRSDSGTATASRPSPTRGRSGPASSRSVAVDRTSTESARGADEAAAPDSPIPDASALALPDYEQLPAAHVVNKLAGLTQAERDAVEAFESRHRNRRTILGKLDQLRTA